MELESILALGQAALDSLAAFGDALRDQDQMPLTQNRKVVALSDDLQLALQKVGFNHQHLVERSTQANDGKLALPR